MKKTLTSALALALTAGFASVSLADPDEDSLTINGDISIVTEAAAPAHMEYVDTIYSGWRFRSDETQAMQMDDFDNPASIWFTRSVAFSRKRRIIWLRSFAPPHSFRRSRAP